MPSRRAGGDHFGRPIHAIRPTFLAWLLFGLRRIRAILAHGN